MKNILRASLLSVATVIGGTTVADNNESVPAVASPSPISPEDLAQSVVLIIGYAPDGSRATGAGFIVDQAGYIATVDHVGTAERAKLFVTLKDGKSYPAKLVGSDGESDVAVLKIDAGRSLPVLKFAQDAHLGDPVIVIGHPFYYQFSVSSGVISAFRTGARVHADFIQFDAPANPGNSGGPVINKTGEVVGLVDWIESPASDMGFGQSAGVNFAVHFEKARKIIDDIIKYGDSEPGVPRFEVENASKPLKIFSSPIAVPTPDAMSPPPARDGARIISIESNSSVSKSGLRIGDVVTKFGDKEIGTANDLTSAIYQTHPGDIIELKVDRFGTEINLAIAMGGDVLPPRPVTPNFKTLAAVVTP